MIYVTGDTHGDFARFSKKKLRIKGMELSTDDYVIVCGDFGLCCSSGMQAILDKGPGRLYEDDVLTDYLQELEDKLEYKHWYFGHYHDDISIDEKHTLLYYAILEIETESDIVGKIIN